MQVKYFPDHHVDTLPPFDARHVQKKKKKQKKKFMHSRLVHNLELY